MEIIEKVIEKDTNKYGTKGATNTAITLGATALGLTVLNGGLGNLFRGTNTQTAANRAEIDALAAKECQDALDLTKFIYEQRIDINNNRFADRQQINQELFGIYKSQTDADLGLYKSQRDGFDVLSKRISDLEASNAVNAAVEPWRAKVLELQIGAVNYNAQNAVALEAERRACADSKIVNYVNSTFYPQYIADVNTKNTSHPAPIYSPLCPCPELV